MVRRVKRMPLFLALAVMLSACEPTPHGLVERGDVEALRARVERDATALEARDDLRKTLLHHAVTFEQLDVARYLIDSGMDLNARDKTGMRPLHAAAALNRETFAKLLLDAGASLEAKDAFGSTPLHMAAMHGATDAIEVLIYEGADLLARNTEGLTPAELARKHRREKLADQLENYLAHRKGITNWE